MVVDDISIRSGALAVSMDFEFMRVLPVYQKETCMEARSACTLNQRASEITLGWTKMAIGVSTRLISEKETPKKRRK